MLILLSVFLFTGKGILSNKHAHFFFALNIHRVHKKFLLMFYYTNVSKKHFLNDGLRKNNRIAIFRNKCEL